MSEVLDQHPSITCEEPPDHGRETECRVVRAVIRHIYGKWTIPVIFVMGSETRRFNQIHRSLPGVSQRMLTVTVRQLERDGLLTRTTYPTIPPTVEYQLTSIGLNLLHFLDELTQWARSNQHAIQAAQDRYDNQLR